jgi:hypothetical protein
LRITDPGTAQSAPGDDLSRTRRGLSDGLPDGKADDLEACMPEGLAR